VSVCGGVRETEREVIIKKKGKQLYDFNIDSCII
jgi:hypothetical protein